ncbi:MAG: SEC59/DGK1/VTE5 family protein [Nanoarchaeota archaeon]|nr:SEC59/DGK1/VTE5 family protein [Nanoarchaeota archaeon]MBU1622873.1 SEC59/DGK1/VTE5 family protein [Nanoarchaeota archaeon]
MLTYHEVGRQVIHLLVGVVTVLLIHFNILSSLAILAVIVIGLLASFICKRTWLPGFSFFLNHFERGNQKTQFPGKGLIFFFIGVLLVVELFDKDIALAAIMILALGDSVSHLVGEKYGKIKNIFNWKGNKLLEGTLAGTFAGFVGAMIFVSWQMAFLGSFVAMVAEVIKIDFNDNTLDDNLVVPLIAGTVMFLLRFYL